MANESFILYSMGNLSDNVSTTTLELGDYFEELNAANCLMYSKIEFDSTHFEMSNIEESLLASQIFQYKAVHLNICSFPSKFEQLNLCLGSTG